MKRHRPTKADLAQFSLENKYFDRSYSPSAVSSSATMLNGTHDPAGGSLNSVAVGDSGSSRDGKQIKILSVQVRGIVSVDSSSLSVTLPEPCLVYVCLVLDRQTNGVQMSSEDCLTNPSGIQSLNVEALRNMNRSGRFLILKEKWFDMTPAALGVDAQPVPDPPILQRYGAIRHFEWFVPLNLVVNFNSVVISDISAINDNSLHVLAFTTYSTGDFQPELGFNSRIRFLG